MAKTALTVTLTAQQLAALDHRADQMLAPEMRALEGDIPARRTLALETLVANGLEPFLRELKQVKVEKLASRLDKLPAAKRERVEALLAEADADDAGAPDA